MELKEFNIHYLPQASTKSGIGNFFMECTLPKEIEVEAKVTVPILVGDVWMLHVDGASNARGSGARMILTSLDGIIVKQPLWFSFKTSNDEAKYEALLVGLTLTHELKVQHLKALSNSQLVIGQVCGEYKAKTPTMEKYLEKVK